MPKFSTVNLVISQGPPLVTLPQITQRHQPSSDARATLENLHLKVKIETGLRRLPGQGGRDGPQWPEPRRPVAVAYGGLQQPSTAAPVASSATDSLSRMVIVMAPAATDADIDAVVAHIEQPRRAGVRQPRRDAHDHRRGRHRGGAGDPRRRRPARASPRRCGSPRRTSWCRRRTTPSARTVRVGGVPIGPDTFTLIAGPCAVETAEQTLESALMAKRAGATLLRGGAYKPRTLAVRVPGPRRGRAADPGRGARRDRAAGRHRGARRRATSTSSPSTPTCCRSAPATCRTSGCCRRSARPASRSCSSAA